MSMIFRTACFLLAISMIGMGPAVAETIRSDAAAQPGQPHPVDNVSVVEQTWSRAGGLLIADITVANVNEFPVVHVIVGCEFIKRGTDAETRSRGSLVPLVLSPGTSKVGGIEFVMSERDMEGGRCRVLSAQRMWSLSPDSEQ
jgi:hypothetical protein